MEHLDNLDEHEFDKAIEQYQKEQEFTEKKREFSATEKSKAFTEFKNVIKWGEDRINQVYSSGGHKYENAEAFFADNGAMREYLQQVIDRAGLPFSAEDVANSIIQKSPTGLPATQEANLFQQMFPDYGKWFSPQGAAAQPAAPAQRPALPEQQKQEPSKPKYASWPEAHAAFVRQFKREPGSTEELRQFRLYGG
jgi:hypothetical protein